MIIQNGYNVYIKLDTNKNITEVNSSAFLQDTTDYVLVEENVMGDKGHHAQGNYLDKPLFDNNGCHNYKYISKKIREATDAEKQAELDSFPKQAPTHLEVLDSKITYIAMMGGYDNVL